MKDKLIRVDEDFAKLINDLAINYSKKMNLPKKACGSRLVTKKLAEQWKRRVIEL